MSSPWIIYKYFKVSNFNNALIRKLFVVENLAKINNYIEFAWFFQKQVLWLENK